MGLRAYNIAKNFVRLVKAKDMQDLEYKAEILDYDGGNEAILENYVVDSDSNGEYASFINLETLQAIADDIDIVHTVFLYGGEWDRRCWGSDIQVYLTDAGEVYMDEAFMDNAFA